MDADEQWMSAEHVELKVMTHVTELRKHGTVYRAPLLTVNRPMAEAFHHALDVTQFFPKTMIAAGRKTAILTQTRDTDHAYRPNTGDGVGALYVGNHTVDLGHVGSRKPILLEHRCMFEVLETHLQPHDARIVYRYSVHSGTCGTHSLFELSLTASSPTTSTLQLTQRTCGPLKAYGKNIGRNLGGIMRQNYVSGIIIVPLLAALSAAAMPVGVPFHYYLASSFAKDLATRMKYYFEEQPTTISRQQSRSVASPGVPQRQQQRTVMWQNLPALVQQDDDNGTQEGRGRSEVGEERQLQLQLQLQPAIQQVVYFMPPLLTNNNNNDPQQHLQLQVAPLGYPPGMTPSGRKSQIMYVMATPNPTHHNNNNYSGGGGSGSGGVLFTPLASSVTVEAASSPYPGGGANQSPVMLSVSQQIQQ